MSGKTNPSPGGGDLRLQAHSRLTGQSGPDGARTSASAALGVLHDLASSPSTAPDALALLHELQVHQVELELQDEELRRSRAELEAMLVRQVQIHDLAPVGCFTVDRGLVLHEINLTGARQLGFERGALLGRAIDSFLAPDSARALHAMLARVAEDGAAQGGPLQLAADEAVPRFVHARAVADPAGSRFLLAFIDIDPPPQAPPLQGQPGP